MGIEMGRGHSWHLLSTLGFFETNKNYTEYFCQKLKLFLKKYIFLS